MRHHTTPCESLLPPWALRLTKRNTNTLSRLPAPQLILQYFRFSPGFPESCTIPKLSRIPAFALLSRTYKPNTRSRTVCPKPKRVSEDKPMPNARAICPDPQRIFEATNKRALGSYPNKGSVVRVWRAALFSTDFTWQNSCCLNLCVFFLKCFN